MMITSNKHTKYTHTHTHTHTRAALVAPMRLVALRAVGAQREADTEVPVVTRFSQTRLCVFCSCIEPSRAQRTRHALFHAHVAFVPPLPARIAAAPPVSRHAQTVPS